MHQMHIEGRDLRLMRWMPPLGSWNQPSDKVVCEATNVEGCAVQLQCVKRKPKAHIPPGPTEHWSDSYWMHPAACIDQHSCLNACMLTGHPFPLSLALSDSSHRVHLCVQ